MATCYRHPSRETGVSCSNCGRAICPDCMTPTRVGMRCPECAGQKTKVMTMRTIGNQGYAATQALIAINVLAFLAEGTPVFTLSGVPGVATHSWVLERGFLLAPYVGPLHQYYRLLTAGFLHLDILHIASNMLVLYLVGRLLEPVIGRVRFVSIYFVALFAGSFGALLFSPTAETVGASGAVFGLLGAAFIDLRRRGIDPWQAGIGGMIVLNLILSFSISGISIGGHIGGLIGGGLAAGVWHLADRRRNAVQLGLAGCVILAAAAIAAAIIFSNTYLPPAGYPSFSL
jgi:membrane associated rhomboid family serine protease